MLKYILKRIFLIIPVVLGISFILFSILNLTPGDPARIILGESATPEAVASLREQMGLNDNFFVRYGRFIWNTMHGDFGTSYSSNQPISQEIVRRLPITFRLALFSISLAIIFGIPIGVLSAIKQYSLIDSISMVTALVFTSIPGFWLGLMLILFFSLKLGWFPVMGADTLKHYILPSVTLSALTLGQLARMTRSSMLEVIREDYIRTAKAKGAPNYRIIFKHALRNALIPVVNLIGINFSIMLGGAAICETVFAIPGLGLLMVNAVKMKDAPTVMVTAMLIAIMGSVVNLLVDIACVFLDPRSKRQYKWQQ